MSSTPARCPLTVATTMGKEESEGASAQPISADSLVLVEYPRELNIGAVEALKQLFRLSDAAAQDTAVTFSRLKEVTPEIVELFLEHVAAHASTDDAKERAAKILLAFVRITAPAAAPASGSKWTTADLERLFVEFDLQTDLSQIAPDNDGLSPPAQVFLDNNKNLTRDSLEEDLTNTTFAHMAYWVYRSRGVESNVDDMVVELFRSIFVNECFLVKTQTVLPLEYSIGSLKRKRSSEATADVILLKKCGQMYKRGLIVVEDKAYIYEAAENPSKAAEAQLMAEAIAVAQQASWDCRDPVYMLRLMGFEVTFYKATFNKEFLNDVRKGVRRLEPFSVKKLVPAGPMHDTGEHGFHLLKHNHRQSVVQVLDNIRRDLLRK